MKFNKHEKEIIRKIADGIVYDIPSYLKAFNLTTLKKLDKEAIEKRLCIEEDGKLYEKIKDDAPRFVNGTINIMGTDVSMGFTVVPFGQGYKDMSPPTKELMKLTLEQRIAHGGHKVLRWMMDNVYVRQDPAGNIKMDKEKSTEKIDAAVATVMALDRAIRNLGSEGSVYDDRGILVF